MKRLLILLCLLVPVAALAQPSEEQLRQDLRENIYRSSLTTCPYEYTPAKLTPAPRGFKPFYISHYGRHGSRTNWDDEGTTYASIQKKYHDAAQAGLLTEEGLAASALIDTLILLHNGSDGRLTRLGAQEHRQIAGRMYANYKEVFRKGSKKVSARSSTVQRVLVSMAAFTGELLSRQGDLDIDWDTSNKIMKIVSSDASRAHRDTLRPRVQQFNKTHRIDSMAFLRRVFKDPEAGRALLGGKGHRLASQTLFLADGCGAFGLDDRLYRLFTEEDILHHAQSNAISLYMRQANSVEYGDLRMPRIEPLLDDIIARADAAIATGEYAADLRFGHDFPLVAISARLALSGVGDRWTFDECINWPGWRYSPFAGNVQLVFYRNKAGEVLVKALINERETAILGLEGFPYYRWEDYKVLLLAGKK